MTPEAPKSLRPVINARIGSKARGEILKERIREEVDPLIDEIYNNKDAEVSGDVVVAAVGGFDTAIAEIADIADEDALEVAYNLVLYAKDKSAVGSGSHGGRECVDNALDAMLVDLLKRRREAGHVWYWAKDLKALERQANQQEALGNGPWYPNSRKALTELAAVEIRKKCKIEEPVDKS